MSSVELDPVYVKCLRLLHSKSKDSEEQLRQMLEDLVRQRNGNTKAIALLQRKDVGIKKEKHSSSRKDDIKRDTDRHSIDDGSLSRELSKKSKSDISKSSHLKSGSTPTSPLSPAKTLLSDTDMKEDIKDDDEDNDDDDDDEKDALALEILEEDLTCVVCRGMDVGVRNQLVECLECHSLYHQECHQPPIPDDMNEPRSAWYCAVCTKALKKMPSSSRSSPKLSSNTSSTRDSEISSPSKISKQESSQSQNAFKRTEKVLSRQSKPLTQSYPRVQSQNKHHLQKLRKMLSPRSPSVSSEK